MKRFFYILWLICLTLPGYTENWDNSLHKIADLKGNWKFMIGDNPQWASEKFDDASWEEIMVPSNWENQGFPGYDGYAWYRKEVFIADDYKNQNLQLELGYIDDVDEVFVNGVKIGQKGSFPPNFWTAYNSERKYLVPSALIHFNQPNVIAIRVYDSQLDGGIIRGKIALYSRNYDLPLDVNLEGLWKFSFGDNKSWINPGFDDSKWKTIIVPGIWEDQVSSGYDGFGWYRTQFKVSTTAKGKRYVLLMGKIDDWDQVYLNGKLVGHTGDMKDNEYQNHPGNEYQKSRYYYLDADDLLPGQINTIAVRVFDKGGEGGIFEGPVGLVELQRFVTYWRNKNK